MLPARRRAISLASCRFHVRRSQHTEPARDLRQEDTSTSPTSQPPLTGSAKLLAEAEAEESIATSSSSRDHLRQTQGPVWNGDETQTDAVLRMLVDAHKPLRSGNGVKHDAADDKIKGWMRGLRLEARMGVPSPSSSEVDAKVEAGAAHRTTIPPHLHRPWHSTYTGGVQTEEVPRVKYGTFIRKNADGDALANLMELQLPPNADGKMKAKARALLRAGKVVRRFEKAREGAIDYKLGLNIEEGGQIVEAEEETFQGNRQVKGSSVLGTQRGGASGLKAWAGLVEDRIQVSHIVRVSLLRLLACTRYARPMMIKFLTRCRCWLSEGHTWTW